MEVGYFNRHRRSDVAYRYFDTLPDLAAWCDVLVVCAPGGPQTRHAVNRDVLAALGPEGFLVNVARGSLVDSRAMIEALRERRIAGAALDVIEGEPQLPDGLIELENLVISPHVGGFSPESLRAMNGMVRDNLDAHFAGRPVLTPVPV
jgi:lactate dehydrogenase-like 2-hydroxyacid dehydrogenase